MKRLSIFIFIFLFLIFRPYQLQQTGMLYHGDDYSYFAHASSIVFGDFPSYDKECYTDGLSSGRPFHPIGSSLMAAPFVYAFSLIDRLNNSDIINKRTNENLASSWALFGFVFASNFYFCLACFLLFKALRLYIEEKPAFNSILFLVLCQGIPLYAFRRPIFSHVYEFALQSFFIYILLLVNKEKDYFKGYKFFKVFLVILASILLSLVRYNNILFTFSWPLVIFGYFKGKTIVKAGTDLLIFAILVLFLCFFLVRLNPFLYNLLGLYFGDLKNIFMPAPLADNLRALWKIFFALNWGIIYIAPFVIIGTFALLASKFPFKKEIILCSAPILVNFYIEIDFFGGGSWYGHRYFLPTVIPLLVYPFAWLIKNWEDKAGKFIYMLFICLAVVPVLSMLCFEGNSTNLTLHVDTGLPGWNNPTYQLEVWKTLLFAPKEFFIAIFKAGPLYVVYLLANIFNISGVLPTVVLEKYPSFDWIVLLKTTILYSLPFVFYKAFNRNIEKPRS